MGSKSLEEQIEDTGIIRKMARHDIANPLTVIVGYSELLRYEEDLKTRVVSNIILKEAKKITNMIDGFREEMYPDPIALLPTEVVEIEIANYIQELKLGSTKIKSHVDKIVGYCTILNGQKNKNYIEEIRSNAERIREVTEMTSIGTLAPEAVSKNKANINPVDLVKRVANHYANKLEGNGQEVGICFHYDPMQKRIFTNQGLLTAMVNALLANAFQYAIRGTLIDIGVRWKDSQQSLEITLENFHDEKPQRETAGEGNGRGLEFLKRCTSQLKGIYEQGVSSNISRYKDLERLCVTIDPPQEGSRLYSTKISIPATAEA